MSLSRIVRFAAYSWLPAVALAGIAQAQTYNVQSDWATTYATSTALQASTSATWGAGGAWSAGELSWNWTNGPIYAGSTLLHATQGGPDQQNLTTYYNANSVGHETSGTSSNVSNIGSYTYTVPFQAYQLDPHSTINQAVGQTVTQMLSTGFVAYAGGKIALPTNWTSNGAASGTIKEIGGVQNIVSTSAYGFSTTGFNLQKTFTDGASGNSTPSGVAGVFYNYGTNVLSTNDPMFNAASSATNHTVTMEGSLGPSYVAWTAPATGTASINLSAWDLGYNNSTNDGVPSFYVITSAGGPTAPLLSVSNLANVGNGNQVGARSTPWSAANNFSATTGSVSLTGQLPAYTAALGYQQGITWSASVSVTAGEVLYFVTDPDHTNGNGKSYEGSQDPVSMQNSINFVPSPEPSSLVLLSLAGIGLGLAAWKRRRRIA
jgi:hypothetical protein